MIVAFLSLPKFLSTDGMLIRLACVQRMWCVIKTDFFRDRKSQTRHSLWWQEGITITSNVLYHQRNLLVPLIWRVIERTIRGSSFLNRDFCNWQPWVGSTQDYNILPLKMRYRKEISFTPHENQKKYTYFATIYKFKVFYI